LQWGIALNYPSDSIATEKFKEQGKIEHAQSFLCNSPRVAKGLSEK
jgi:hypothetical protein